MGKPAVPIVLSAAERRELESLARAHKAGQAMARRAWAPLYLRGLLGPGERKSLQPMAARPGLSGYGQLQHFIANAAWDYAPLWTVLAREANRLVWGPVRCGSPPPDRRLRRA